MLQNAISLKNTKLTTGPLLLEQKGIETEKIYTEDTNALFAYIVNAMALEIMFVLRIWSGQESSSDPRPVFWMLDHYILWYFES